MPSYENDIQRAIDSPLEFASSFPTVEAARNAFRQMFECNYNGYNRIPLLNGRSNSFVVTQNRKLVRFTGVLIVMPFTSEYIYCPPDENNKRQYYDSVTTGILSHPGEQLKFYEKVRRHLIVSYDSEHEPRPAKHLAAPSPNVGYIIPYLMQPKGTRNPEPRGFEIIHWSPNCNFKLEYGLEINIIGVLNFQGHTANPSSPLAKFCRSPTIDVIMTHHDFPHLIRFGRSVNLTPYELQLQRSIFIMAVGDLLRIDKFSATHLLLHIVGTSSRFGGRTSSDLTDPLEPSHVLTITGVPYSPGSNIVCFFQRVVAQTFYITVTKESLENDFYVQDSSKPPFMPDLYSWQVKTAGISIVIVDETRLTDEDIDTINARGMHNLRLLFQFMRHGNASYKVPYFLKNITLPFRGIVLSTSREPHIKAKNSIICHANEPLRGQAPIYFDDKLIGGDPYTLFLDRPRRTAFGESITMLKGKVVQIYYDALNPRFPNDAAIIRLKQYFQYVRARPVDFTARDAEKLARIHAVEEGKLKYLLRKQVLRRPGGQKDMEGIAGPGEGLADDKNSMGIPDSDDEYIYEQNDPLDIAWQTLLCRRNAQSRGVEWISQDVINEIYSLDHMRVRRNRDVLANEYHLFTEDEEDTLPSPAQEGQEHAAEYRR